MNANKGELLYPELSYVIQGCFFDIRNSYGPGQKEVIYQRLLYEKLIAKGVTARREVRISIYSEDSGKVVGLYQPDLVIDDFVIIEVKSSRFSTKLDETQLYYYLRNSKYELGYLVNFSTPKLFIKRIVYSNIRKPFLKHSC